MEGLGGGNKGPVIKRKNGIDKTDPKFLHRKFSELTEK